MSDAERMYRDGYGCSCHSHPPCPFCMALTEEEANVLWNGSILDLREYWRVKRTLQDSPPVIEYKPL